MEQGKPKSSKLWKAQQKQAYHAQFKPHTNRSRPWTNKNQQPPPKGRK